MSVMTVWNFCINTYNSSNVDWCLSGRRRNFKDLITSFFKFDIAVCKYFADQIKKALTSFKNFL